MTQRKWILAAAAIAAGWLFAAARPARATLIIVPNASFETPDVADNGATDTDVDGPGAVPSWSFTSSLNGTINAGVWDPVAADYSGTNGTGALPGTGAGSQLAYIYLAQTNDSNVQPLSGILATSSSVATVQSNTRYDLTIALGNAKTFNPDEVSIQMQVNGETAASRFVAAGTIPEGTFTDFTTSFTTGPNDPLAGGSLIIRVVHTHFNTGEAEADFDNVRLNSTFVPEPASATLALAGIGAIALRRRRPRSVRSPANLS